MMPTLLALTPNLALDRTMRLDRPFRPGRLHRVQALRVAAGGKGVNLARTVRALGGDVVVAGFVAGFNGAKLRGSLEAEGLPAVLEEVPGETRECHILLEDDGHPTEINERGVRVNEEAWNALLARLPAGWPILCGSLPPGLDEAGFARALQRLPRRPIVDMPGMPLRVALEAGAAMVSPNRAELAAYLEQDTATPDDAAAVFETWGVPVLLSLGSEGAAYVGKERVLARAPRVDVDNPVGSGDCLLGAFAWARVRGRDVGEALRWGVAAGSDNARQGGGGSVSRAGVEELYVRVSLNGLD